MIRSAKEKNITEIAALLLCAGSFKLKLDLGLSVNVEICRGNGVPLVFLHGWGGSSRSFGGAYDYFASRGRICFAIDFPPFGKSDLPPEDWSLGDYTAMTLAAMDKCGIGRAVLIGHSFGGRVAIDIAAKTGRAEKLILTDSAGLKPRRGIKYRLRQAKFRNEKAEGKDVSGYYSPDYLALPERMRGVFSRVVAEDLTDRLSHIQCPTLIVWGKKDKETPPYMARRLRRGIENSKLIMLDGGHFAYAEKHFGFVSALDDFIGN